MKITFSVKQAIVFAHFSLLLVFIVFRACVVPIIPDEALTFFLYVDSETVVGSKAVLDANNHYLNSILSIFSTKLFGLSAFTFRLPNVLFFVLYYYAVYKIASMQQSRFLFWSGLIAFTSVYPVLEFFSLSRGYGMSFALLLFLVYQCMVFVEDKKKSRAWFCIVLGLLTLSSQLSLLFAVSGILFIVTLNFLSLYRKQFLIQSIAINITVLATLIFFAVQIKQLQDSGLLYFGLSDNFPFGNLTSINLNLFQVDNIFLSYGEIFLIFLLIFSPFVYRKKLSLKGLFKPENVFNWALLSSILGLLIAVYVFDGKGPEARTGLYLYLLLLGTMLFILPKIKVVQIAFSIFLVFTSLVSMNQLNTIQVNYWEHYCLDKKIFEFITKEDNDFAIVGCSSQLDRAIEMSNNFIHHNSAKAVSVIDSDINSFDFVLLTRDESVRFSEELKNFKRLFDGGNRVSLFQNLNPSTQPEVVENKQIFAKQDKSEYFGISTIDVSKRIDLNSPYVFKLDGFCRLKKRTDSFQFVMQFFDEHENVIGRNFFYLHQLSPNWNRGEKFEIYIPMVEIPKHTTEIKVYLHNPKGIEIVEMETEISLNKIVVQHAIGENLIH